MPRNHTRGRGPRRMTDWSGVRFNESVTSVSPTAQVNLWTPIVEDQKATIVRIVGEIYVSVDPNSMQVIGAFEQTCAVGIQIVNRASGAAGNARNPKIEDDLEGGEWLFLRHYCFNYVVLGATSVENMFGIHQFIQAPDPHVDIRVKRKIDLSQDELLLSFAGSGTGTDAIMCGSLRLLLMQG